MTEIYLDCDHNVGRSLNVAQLTLAGLQSEKTGDDDDNRHHHQWRSVKRFRPDGNQVIFPSSTQLKMMLSHHGYLS